MVPVYYSTQYYQKGEAKAVQAARIQSSDVDGRVYLEASRWRKNPLRFQPEADAHNHTVYGW